jgi:hypothetical protein
MIDGMTLRQVLGRAVKRLLEDRRKTPTALARAMNLPKSQMSEFLGDTKNVAMHRFDVNVVASFVDRSAADLFLECAAVAGQPDTRRTSYMLPSREDAETMREVWRRVDRRVLFAVAALTRQEQRTLRCEDGRPLLKEERAREPRRKTG